ncbi:hypothetical protein V8J82_19250 [Gymnodinialimonas sp. 2305UL16-5]|uniref:hypothetical protein n=1 Tax=Gymnodinialimonas mytili TaxID=3126503 RepID=UPI00309597ED
MERRYLRFHGLREVGQRQIKLYGLTVEPQDMPSDLIAEAEHFLATGVAEKAPPSALGFAIVHPGVEGVSVAAHWWEQGSVLCHHIQRRLYASDQEARVAERGVIGCVWELAVIAAEQGFWRETMMNRQPAPDAYLAQILDVETV